ncbi:MAG: amidohydrolase family protein [Armatimonadetes bacterium]|nr:amidohydrolase family protein [Armatimonadota bacterium]
MIDIHLHIGRLYTSMDKPFTADDALRFMDANGIQKACLLPIENPEETDYYVTTDQILVEAGRHPDRFIPFCNIDPRRRSADLSTDFLGMLREYRDRGCRGFGEVLAGLYVDDPRLQRIYAACGELGLPIVFHLDALRCIDEKGLPRFEAMVRSFPQTIFIGHGQHFWSEISADVRDEEFSIYPKGPVKRVGPAERLIAECPNLYGDLSAGSGHNAVTRDPQFGRWLLETYQDKLLFGTDKLKEDQETPIIEHLRTVGLPQDAYEKIAFRNAEVLLPA